MKKLIVFPSQGGLDLAAAAAGREEIIARGGLRVEVIAVGDITSAARVGAALDASTTA